MGGKQTDNPQVRPRRFASFGICCAGSKFAQSLGRHLKAFDRHFQVGRTGPKSDGEALGGTAFIEAYVFYSDWSTKNP